jgi:isopenicillin N synthase-like dioxygenase
MMHLKTLVSSTGYSSRYVSTLLILLGFIYVTNFGLSQDEVDEQYGYAQELFDTPLEEKNKYLADLAKGEYIGYKPFGLREVKPGVPENTEVYNIPRFGPDVKPREHPAAITRHWSSIEKFSKHVHENIVMKLFTLFAIVLELPENHFSDLHRYDDDHTSYLRYMKYHSRTPEQNEALENIWLKGHTDFGSLTLLFRQPIVALQVRTPKGEWKYVKPYPQSITVNVADTLQFLSNGFLKSSIHRVVAPPSDQAHLDRLGVIYFVRAGENVVLKGAKSRVLDREGLLASEDPKDAILAKDWVAARTIANISDKQVQVEKEELNEVGDGLMPVYD